MAYLDKTGLTQVITNINEKFSKKSHTHTKSEITDFAHNHDDRYYTESEIDSKVSALNTSIAGKSDSDHTHSAATTTANGFMSASDKAKLDGISAGANAITVDSSLSSTSTNPVQNKVVNSALSGKVPATRTVNGKALSANITLTANDVSADASGSAASALATAKAYTDSEISDLINGAPTTLDTLGEIATAMQENEEVVDVLEAAIGTKANSSDLTTHTGNTTVHITSTERTSWNGAVTHANSAHAPSNAEKNQNAFSNIVVGSTTIAADSATDTLTFVAGNNISFTPDATNDKITITATDTTYAALTETEIDEVFAAVFG